MERWSLDPGLRRILLHMIIPLSTLPPIPLTQLPDEYKMLLTTQCSIGTGSLLFGFFCDNWVRVQDRYIWARGLPSSQQEATRAICSLIQLFNEQCHSVWLLRNQHLHGTYPTNTTSYKHLHLLAQIQELYDAAPLMMSHDCDIFTFPQELRKLQSTSILTAFYRHAKPIVGTSLKQAAQQPPDLRPIDDYFCPLILAALFNVILGR
jgi:hypothetical protein